MKTQFIARRIIFLFGFLLILTLGFAHQTLAISLKDIDITSKSPVLGYAVDEQFKMYTDGVVGDEYGDANFGSCKVYTSGDKASFEAVIDQYRYMGDRSVSLPCSKIPKYKNTLLVLLILLGIFLLVIMIAKKSKKTSPTNKFKIK